MDDFEDSALRMHYDTTENCYIKKELDCNAIFDSIIINND